MALGDASLPWQLRKPSFSKPPHSLMVRSIGLAIPRLSLPEEDDEGSGLSATAALVEGGPRAASEEALIGVPAARHEEKGAQPLLEPASPTQTAPAANLFSPGHERGDVDCVDVISLPNSPSHRSSSDHSGRQGASLGVGSLGCGSRWRVGVLISPVPPFVCGLEQARVPFWTP
jgi:hypothetical protein